MNTLETYGHLGGLAAGRITEQSENTEQALDRQPPGPVEVIVQELCESRGGRPGLSVLTSLLVSVDVKLY